MAQLVYPKTQVIAEESDFGFLIALAELVTAVENSLPIRIVVFKNRGKVSTKFEQLSQGVTIRQQDLPISTLQSLPKLVALTGNVSRSLRG